jgi:hypothetical protein
MDIAATLLEDDAGEHFLETFKDRIADTYNAITELDSEVASEILTDIYDWAFSNRFCSEEQVNLLTS